MPTGPRAHQASGDLERTSTITEAATAGRTTASRTDHGHVRVEPWTAATT